MENNINNLVSQEIVNDITNYNLDNKFLYGLLTIKVDPHITTDEVKDFFYHQYDLTKYSKNELIKLREIICNLFATLRNVSELKREFSSFDDYLARYDTYLTVFTLEIESRK